MNDVVRLLLMLALAGTAVTFAGSFAIWFFDEDRRIGRALKRVLKGEPEAMLVARGRGRGVGVNFATGLAAVAWDAGAWCLVYRIDELMGAELIIDDQVVARAHREEPRRALDQRVSHAARVTLRLIFDDPQHPDFELDLWLTGDESRRVAASPGAAVLEANRWLARAEAILRRPRALNPSAAAAAAVTAPLPPPAAPGPTPPPTPQAELPLPQPRAGAEPPPWEDDDDLDPDDDQR
ncbi:MAG: hypothetical protein Q8N10_13865 [Phenylobacterium sp.]|uniref:hypothetical protein n=1 Tax=Phenylobacterium sp. TaxID=1871053 RepID=UPI00271D16B0|nr:hypothetical protein [Phenylobacterium sp.]MDO8912827.1 hypothetical protein [Phenylobacterium sp.]MDP3101573.1 hypothetical protein [Phenylobacterium sp.]